MFLIEIRWNPAEGTQNKIFVHEAHLSPGLENRDDVRISQRNN